MRLPLPWRIAKRTGHSHWQGTRANANFSFCIGATANPNCTDHRSVAQGAAQRVEAVLRVWSERGTPSQICREMNITWTILNHWQQRAMEGMLQALEPGVRLDKGQALSPRLQELIRKRSAIPKEKLATRLRRLEKKEQQRQTGG